MRIRARHVPATLILVVSGCAQPKNGLLSKHFSSHRKEQAQQHWDSVRGEVKLQLARQHLEAGRVDDAEKVIEQAVAITPTDPKTFVLLARLRLEQGRLAEAKDAIGHSLVLASSDPEVCYVAGIVAERYNDLEQAEQFYAAAATLGPNIVAHVLAHAEILVVLDRPADALELIEGRLKDFDTSAALRLLAARTCRSLGLRGPAAAHCREALRLNPDDPSAASEAGSILLWAGRLNDVVAVLAPRIDSKQRGNPRLISDRPTSDRESGDRRCLAAAYYRLDRNAEALKTLEPVLDDEPVDVASCALYARVAIASGELASATKALARARQGGAPTSELLLISALAAFRQGDFANAIELSKQAIGIEPTLTAAHYLRGRSAEVLGRLDEAKDAYAHVLKLGADSTTTRAWIAALDPSDHCELMLGKTPVTKTTSYAESAGASR